MAAAGCVAALMAVPLGAASAESSRVQGAATLEAQTQWEIHTDWRINMCLDVDSNGGGRDGSKVQLWRCNGRANQKWLRDGYHWRSVAYPSKCLDSVGSGDGAKVQIWGCWNGTPQQWAGGRDGLVYNGRPGYPVLDADRNGGGDGTRVQMWHVVEGNNNQQWFFVVA
ncbi:RICIN domain-containing protein [Luteipulveratus sp. YIM 133132]|uniref:RICIN domain-containing protein n=1 Tax=Luteipulveratus flavus TaxID=3031728 RepID=UPI0023B1BE46|nr:RICIN domain-containing protein [Luteipulveratus sp. YIM 133132]MDE9364748.1 RICIN domain-containing protein [Luteipulveratus sp. YIM 133132]